ncbi:MAG TPA: hypothetical protein VFW99_04145 [Candidatus Nitrosotalea sp.]|nr:hypothetical protein [Candidatus Nitrosotalea sp.]
MERKQSIALFGIVVVAAITIGVIGLTNSPSAGLSANMIDEKQHILGHAVLTVLDPKGNVIAYRQTDNQITNLGDDCAAKGLFGTAGACSSFTPGTSTFKYIAIGTSSAGLSNSNTNLAAETTSFTTARITTTPSITPAASGAGSTVSLTATFVTNAAVTAQEAGIFDTSASNSGNMFARQGFTPIQLLSGDSLGITWTVNTK